MKYNGRLPEGVITPSKLAAYVNLNKSPIMRKKYKKSKASKPIKRKT